FNGIQNILSDDSFANLKKGDLLNDDSQNPIIFSA
ncbi:MAG: phytanoyl-CoA dioxygenase, partial [Flavobacteriaceae bacterium]|nr:phytanoyl-CoA dioxygenase [Flavobacteriaceae bacterium]